MKLFRLAGLAAVLALGACATTSGSAPLSSGLYTPNNAAMLTGELSSAPYRG